MTLEEAHDAQAFHRMVGTRVGLEVVVGWIKTLIRHDKTYEDSGDLVVVMFTLGGKRVEVPIDQVYLVKEETLGGFED